MIASSILLGRALAPVEQAMGSWRNFVAARAAYGRLKSRLEQIPQEPDRIRLPEPYGNLSLERVSFAPAGSRGPILDNVSMRVIPGEAVAVIGPSAGGKSTLCRVLTGVTTPTSGEVRLDGSELFHWDPVQIGAHIGYLPQDVELFPGSVRENIARMGEVDDAKVIRAALLRMRMSSSRRCRRATTRRSAMAARGCRAASASSSGSPGPSMATRA